jgi:hypothetical protein
MNKRWVVIFVILLLVLATGVIANLEEVSLATINVGEIGFNVQSAKLASNSDTIELTIIANIGSEESTSIDLYVGYDSSVELLNSDVIDLIPEWISGKPAWKTQIGTQELFWRRIAFLSGTAITGKTELVKLKFRIIESRESYSFSVKSNSNIVDASFVNFVPNSKSPQENPLVIYKNSPAVLFGDVDLNGKLNLGDAIALAKHYLKVQVLTEIGEYTDVDCNSRLNLGDAIYLAKVQLRVTEDSLLECAKR